jgi:hypothetical protein
VTLNRDGFRDRDHAPEVAAGVRRLLVVGDSFAFGIGLESIEDRFGERVRDRLSVATHVPWESMNASRPDSHTRQEIEYLDRGLPMSRTWFYYCMYSATSTTWYR